jgi:hypothetical protein
MPSGGLARHCKSLPAAERETEREREIDRRGLRNKVVGQGCKEWGEGIGPRSDRLLAFR